MKAFFSKTAFLLGLLFSPSSLVFADCSGSGICCACPGVAQNLGSYSSCEEACGVKSGNPSFSEGSAARAERARVDANRRSQEKEAQKERLLGDMIGVDKTEPLQLMTDEAKPGAVSPQNVKTCGALSVDVSKALQNLQIEARSQAYSFITNDIGQEIITEKNLENMKARDYKVFHDKTRKSVDRLKDFGEELGQIQACLNLKGCDLAELNKKINSELKSWLKGYLQQSTKKAIDRVKEARSFLRDYTKRITQMNEAALKAATSCSQP